MGLARIGVLSVVALLLFSFQNCGVAPQEVGESAAIDDSAQASDTAHLAQLISVAKTQPLEPAYQEKFDQAPQHWYSILATESDPWTSQYVKMKHSGSSVSTQGTYWIDNNHIKPTGAGTLNLYAFTYPKDVGLEDKSFLEGVFRVRIKANGFRISQTTQIGLWFQAYDPDIDRYVNYFQTSQTIDTALGYDHISKRTGPQARTSEWVTVDIPFSSNDADWVCLGSRPEKLHIYGCSSSVARILSRKIHDFGIFGFMESTQTSLPSQGSLEIDQVEVLMRPGLRHLEVPIKIHEPSPNQVVAGASLKVRGTCPKGKAIEVAVGWTAVKGSCRDDEQFSFDLPLSGRSGTLAVSVRPADGSAEQITIPVRYRASVAPLAVTEILRASGSSEGQSALVRGTCDTSKSRVLVALGSGAQLVTCGDDERFQAAFDSVSGTLERISLGVKYEADSVYAINDTISVTQATEALTVDSPRAGDVVSDPQRRVEVAGTCTRAGSQIQLAVGWSAEQVICGADGRFKTTIQNKDVGVNIAVAAKYVTDPSYRVQFGVQFR